MSVSPFSHSANHTPSPHRKALETPLFQFKTFPSRRQSQVSILLLLDSGVPWELFRTPNSQLQGKSINDSMETLNILKVPGTETHEIGNHSCLPSLELKSLSGETLEVINGSDAIENYLEQELRFSKNQIELTILEKAMIDSTIFECTSFLLNKLYQFGSEEQTSFLQFFNSSILPFLTHLEGLLSSSTFPFSKLLPTKVQIGSLNRLILHVHLLLSHLFEIFPSHMGNILFKNEHITYSHLFMIWKEVESRKSVLRFESELLGMQVGEAEILLREDQVFKENIWWEAENEGNKCWDMEIRERCRKAEKEN